MYSGSGFPSYLLTREPPQSSAVVEERDEFSADRPSCGANVPPQPFIALQPVMTNFLPCTLDRCDASALSPPRTPARPPLGSCRRNKRQRLLFLTAELSTLSPERSHTGPTSLARLAITLAWRSGARRAGPRERSQVQLFLMELNDSLLSVGLRASGRCRSSQLPMLDHIAAV